MNSQSNSSFINLILLGGTTSEKLAAASQAGFSQVELWRQDLESYGDGEASLESEINKNKLSLTDYQVLLDFDGAPDDLRAAKREEAVRMLESSRKLGATTLLTPASTDARCIQGRIVEDMKWLTDQAAQRNLRIAYEGMAWSRFNHSLPAALEVVKAVDRQNLGLVVDAFHIFVRNRTIEDLKGVPVEKIFLVQLSDLDQSVNESNLIEIARHRRLLPGEGRFPVRDLIRRLRDMKYTGPLGLEVFNDDLKRQDPITVAKKAMESLQFVCD